MSIPAEAFFTQRQRTCWCSCSQKVEEEIARLRAVEFFRYENHKISNGQLHVVGTVYRERRYGGTESLRIRLEYPDNFPGEEPTVFDCDKQFKPSPDGHQFSNYALCLRFPFRRNEFNFRIDNLGEEVLGATLSWLIKRNIFERTREWPGQAEEHGWAKPLAKLAMEAAQDTRNYLLEVWAELCITNLILPKLDRECPCGRGKRVSDCHSDLALMIGRAVLAAQCEVKDGDR